MTLRIERADFQHPSLLAFLAAHHADMAPQSPAESQHALGLEALKQPGVRLWVGWIGEQLVATCALAHLAPGHEELKSMRTDPELRGRGIASKMLEHTITEAVSRGVKQISLETGSVEFFASARRLYAANGFSPCEPFGSYTHDPYSTYMSLSLDSSAS